MADSSGTPSHLDLDGFDLGVHYGLARQRISDLVVDVEDPAGVPVPACPGWSVHDVVAHLVAVVEDVLAGRLTGPPSHEETAEQVGRRKDLAMASMIAEWAGMAPQFEDLLSQVRVWPGYLDVLAHEHDVRGALSVPAGRDSYEMEVACESLLSGWKPAVTVHVNLGERTTRRGHTETGGTSSESAGDLTLMTTPFEVFRFRLGRRSPSQLRAMDWTGDPTPVIAGMTIFGPEPYDIIE